MCIFSGAWQGPRIWSWETCRAAESLVVFCVARIIYCVCVCVGATEPHLVGDSEAGFDGWGFVSEAEAGQYGGGSQPHRERRQAAQSRGTLRSVHHAITPSLYQLQYLFQFIPLPLTLSSSLSLFSLSLYILFFGSVSKFIALRHSHFIPLSLSLSLSCFITISLSLDHSVYQFIVVLLYRSVS